MARAALAAARPVVMLDKENKTRHKSNTQRDSDKARRRRKTSNKCQDEHISWTLKRKARERQATTIFRGQRIVFE